MKKFYVEKLNASDDTFKINDIYFETGEYVEKGDLIFSLESSKADIDIESEESGYLYFIINQGGSINVNELLFIISKKEITDYSKYFENQNSIDTGDLIISKKAQILIDKFNLTPELINKKVIREIDVLNFIEKSKSSSEFFNENLLLTYETDKTPIVIIGAGGGAKMCIDALNDSNVFTVVGLLDDNVSLGTKILGIPVIGNFSSVESLLKISINNFIIAFGVLSSRQTRYNLFLSLKKKGCIFPNIIHSKSIIENSVIMGEGNVVLAGANIGSSVILGDLNYINNNSLLSHDCVLKDNIHIAPSAVLASSIKIQSHALIGMNSTLFYGISIGENSTILNGLIINFDIGDNIIQKSNKYENS